MYEAIAQLLLDRGWKRDASAVPNKQDELREFTHPDYMRLPSTLYEAIWAEESHEATK